MLTPAKLEFIVTSIGLRTLRKVRWRIMPVVGLLYFVAFLDRNNVGFAKLTMSHDIGLSSAAYGFGAGVFFIGYALTEIPSNGGMYRYGARRRMAPILVSWGIVATEYESFSNCVAAPVWNRTGNAAGAISITAFREKADIRALKNFCPTCWPPPSRFPASSGGASRRWQPTGPDQYGSDQSVISR